MQAIEWFVYNKSVSKFMIKGEWRALKLEDAVERLKQIWLDNHGTELRDSEAQDLLRGVKLMGLSSEEIQRLRKALKDKASRPDWEMVYAELKPKLGICFYMGPDKKRSVYTVDERKQVAYISYESEQSIYDALYANDELWRELREYYRSNPSTEAIRAKYSFTDFVRTLIRDELLNDPDLKLERPPVAISWQKDEYAFRKLDDDLFIEGPTPTWDEFLSRLDYPELFMAWVWSIFEPTNTVRQVCWIRGPGQDGKSEVQKALEYAIGEHQCYSVKENDLGNQFFLGSVYGKILITFPDCGYLNLIKKEAIKQITGGDSASIERKGEQAKSGVLRAKLLVHSNKDPLINPESRFQTTRLLRLILQKTDKRDSQFGKRLKEEVWAFLAKCRPMFEKHVAPGQDNIAIPADVFSSMVTACSGGSYLIMKHFEKQNIVYAPDAFCPFADLAKRFHEYQVQQCLTNEQLRFMTSEWQECLRERGLENPVQVDGPDGADFGYKGFRLKGSSGQVKAV